MSDKSNEVAKNIHKGHRKRLRERYKRSGMDDYAAHEVMELLLTYAIPRIDVNAPAHELIERFGSVAGVLDATVEELCEVDLIGPEAAYFLKMLPDVFRRYSLDRCDTKQAYDTLDKIGEFLFAKYVGVTVERVYLLLFNNRMQMIDCCHLGDGSVNCASITVRRVPEYAILKKASVAVLAHNHPTGLPFPSQEDIEMTRSVENSLNAVNIPLLEHIIVTENSYAPLLRHQKGLLRCSPLTRMIDREFYERFYGESSTASSSCVNRE